MTGTAAPCQAVPLIARPTTAAAGTATPITAPGGAATLTTAPVDAAELYDAALQAHAAGRAAALSAVCAAWSCDLPLSRWCAPTDDVEVAALDRLHAVLPGAGAVLDLGCGPGRHGATLARRGLRVLGVDTSPIAVALTRARSVPALQADALGGLPDGWPGGGPGWSGVLLLDGNIGIGGDPLRLLCRVRDLLAPAGRLLVEVDAEGVTDRHAVHLCDGTRTSAPFAWARLGGDDLPGAARIAGLTVLDCWRTAGRAFALLGPVQP